MMVNVLFNIAMLLTLSVFFTTYPFKNPRKLYSYHILVGIVIGVVGILVMLNPFILEEGVVFDSRSILIVVSGMVFGLTPTLIGSGMIAVFRILKGGVGLYAGLATIITSTMVGVLWHHYRYQIVLERRRHINIEFYLVGFLDHAIMLLCMLLMPSSVRIHVFSVMTFPILVFYPVGTYLLCLLLFSQAYRLARYCCLEKKRTAVQDNIRKSTYRDVSHQPEDRRDSENQPELSGYLGIYQRGDAWPYVGRILTS